MQFFLRLSVFLAACGFLQSSTAVMVGDESSPQKDVHAHESAPLKKERGTVAEEKTETEVNDEETHASKIAQLEKDMKVLEEEGNAFDSIENELVGQARDVPCQIDFVNKLKDAANAAAECETGCKTESHTEQEDSEYQALVKEMETTVEVETPASSVPCAPLPPSPTASKAKSDGTLAETYAMEAYKAEMEAKKTIKIASLKRKRAMMAKETATQYFQAANAEATNCAKEACAAAEKAAEEEQRSTLAMQSATSSSESMKLAKEHVAEAKKMQIQATAVESAQTEAAKTIGDIKCKAECEAKAAAEAVVKIAKDASDSMSKISAAGGQDCGGGGAACSGR